MLLVGSARFWKKNLGAGEQLRAPPTPEHVFRVCLLLGFFLLFALLKLIWLAFSSLNMEEAEVAPSRVPPSFIHPFFTTSPKPLPYFCLTIFFGLNLILARIVQ